MSGPLLALLSVLIPAAGAVLLLLIFTLRGIVVGFLSLFPVRFQAFVMRVAGPVLLWVPPKGRVTRSVGWCFLFSTLLALLLIPALGNPWTTGLWFKIGAGLTPSVWLVALSVAVASLCAAVSAWESESPPSMWLAILVMECLCLASIVLITTLPLRLAALDGVGLLVGLLLTVYSEAEVAPLRGSLLKTTRRWLGLTLLASVGSWLAVLFPAHLMFLLPLAALARAGVFPLHTPLVGTLHRLAAPLAMLVAGAVLPSTLLLATETLSAGSSGFQYLLAPAAVALWCASLVQPTLRHTIGYWILAGGSTSLALVSFRTSILPTHLMIVSLGAGGTMAVFLTSLIKRDVGHDEVPRLQGLAARLPGAYGWFIIAIMVLTAAPPFAMAAALLLAIPQVSSPLALGLLGVMWPLGSACAFSVAGKVFLGLPRRDLEPLELSGRQRLILVLLLVTCLITAFAPATLLRGPNIPAIP